MTTLDRQSELYSHMGNISAEGIQRLLGTPTIDRLQTVIREAVQNSWDAAAPYRKPVFRVHLRSLTRSEMTVLREVVFADVVEERSDECLAGFLKKSNPYVLELSDFGTGGLGGPTDASVITEAEDESDFVDFIRNVGSPRDTVYGGGTYGYGKSSLYGLSQCRTIVVDSLTTFDGQEERRLISCRVASSFTVKSGHNKGKYTGRHWWGKSNRTGTRLNPVSGRAARSLAQKLGTAERHKGDLGTSIMILDPIMDESPDTVINAIQRTLLWNFWPKLVKYPRKGASMKFEVWLDGTAKPLPDPEECPPLDLFVAAMKKVKSGGGVPIECQRPQQFLGSFAIEKGPKGRRIEGFGPGEDGLFPESARHVALMRPAELVVKYLEGNLLPPTAEWGGLFLCADEHEVEQAFAQAEPPAHDDWIPRHMPRGRLKTFVNVALREVSRQMEQAVSAPGINAEGGTAELARLSGTMGALLNGALGDRLTVHRPGNKGGRQRAKRSLRITNLEGWGPAEWDSGEVLAWFRFEVDSPGAREITLSGKAKVFIDGEVSDETPDGLRPEIRIWADKDEEFLAEGDTLTVNSDNASQLWVGLSIPEECAVSFTPEILE